jgi:spore coat protein U-like protein
MSTYIKNNLTKACYCIATGLIIGTTYVSMASAATLTGNLSVSASVAASCSIINPGTLAFGAYTGSQIDVTATIAVTCVNLTPYNVGLNAGNGVGATISVRKLTSGGNTLNYSMFRDAGRTQNWGNTVGTDTLAGTGNGSSQTLTVYGRLPGSQTLNVGSYTDTVVATITF